MFRTKLVRLTQAVVVGESRRTLAVKVDRLRSANFVDVKQSLALSNELKEQTFRLRGWINSTVKSKKTLCFFHLNDGLSNDQIQVVLSKELENSLQHNLVYGTSLICTGQLVESKGKSQAVEFKCNQIEFAGQTELFPFYAKERYHSDDWDHIRQHLHLRFKSRHFASLQRIRGKLLVYAHEYLQAAGYSNITTPIITMNDCEGGGEAFQVLSGVWSPPVTKDNQTDEQSDEQTAEQTESSDRMETKNQANNETATSSNPSSIDDAQPNSTTPIESNANETFFGKPTFLTVSGQLHLEAAALGVGRVYTLSPCFRSEVSISRKHLCEFLMLELEEAYLDSLDVLMDRVERLCKDLLVYLTSECREEIDLILSKKDKFYLDAIINHDYKR